MTENLYRLYVEQSSGISVGCPRNYTEIEKEKEQASKSTKFCGYIFNSDTDRFTSPDNLHWMKFSIIEDKFWLAIKAKWHKQND